MMIRPLLRHIKHPLSKPTRTPYTHIAAPHVPPPKQTTPLFLGPRRGSPLEHLGNMKRIHSSSVTTIPSFRILLNYIGLQISHLIKRAPSRPWTLDERIALLSWLFLCQTVLVLASTTSVVSVFIWLANQLEYTDLIKYALGWYLTQLSGSTVIVSGTIDPNWKDGTIDISDVHVSRMLASDESSLFPNNHSFYTKHPFPLFFKAKPAPNSPSKPQHFDNNFIKYDLTVDSISICLDVVHWLDGNGFIQTAKVRGVRGFIDRRDVYFDPTLAHTWLSKRTSQFGDFEIHGVHVDDLFVTLYNKQFRTYSVSVFSGDLPRLRKQWLLYDLICATSLVGLFDNCLFSIHTPQDSPKPAEVSCDTHQHDQTIPRRISRLKIDGVPIDHLNYGTSGPFGWITGGTLDISALIYIPRHRRPQDVDELVSQLMTSLKATTALDRVTLDDLQRKLPDTLHTTLMESFTFLDDLRRSHTTDHANDTDLSLAELAESATKPMLVMDLELRINNLRAQVPMLLTGKYQTPEIPSYMTTNTLIRPVVAYMNSHLTAIPIRTIMSVPVALFDGAWTIYQARLSEVLASRIGASLMDRFWHDTHRNRRMKKLVGYWSIRAVAEAISSLFYNNQLLFGYLNHPDPSPIRPDPVEVQDPLP